MDFTRRETLELLGTVLGPPGSAEREASDWQYSERDSQISASSGTLKRLATTVTGAEITGLHVSDAGELFFNVQHPNPLEVDGPYGWGTVGAVRGVDLRTLSTDFESIPVPETERQRETVRTAVGQYTPLANGGDPIEGGGYLGVPETPDGYAMRVGYMPSYNGFVRVDEETGYLFTNWESRPGMMSRTKLERTGSLHGEWTVTHRENLDFREVGGTWFNCFGTVTPWNTPLSSEEYEPDAKQWEEGWFNVKQYLMDVHLDESPNPYRYGYILEVQDPTGEDPTPVKHYAMGRFSHENAVVMPDEKTAYLSDDDTGTVLFKFVADEAGDLSAGTLYAAKAVQEMGSHPENVGFDLEWVELAHGDDDIESWIAEYDDGGYVTEDEVEAWAAGRAEDDRAAFLESRDAAAAAGATAEFRKMEGINVRPGAEPGDYVYVSMSEINETMSDGTGDVQLDRNDYGVVYRMELDENYDVSRMVPAVVGGPEGNVCGGCPYDADPEKSSEPCRNCSHNPTNDEDERSNATLADTAALTNHVTNPDNLVVLEDGRLLVGEDTDAHENCYIWLFDPDDGS